MLQRTTINICKADIGGQEMNARWNGKSLVILTEHESGYGQREYHAVEFDSLSDAEKYVEVVHANNNNHDCYIRARVETDPRKFDQYKRFLQ